LRTTHMMRLTGKKKKKKKKHPTLGEDQKKRLPPPLRGGGENVQKLTISGRPANGGRSSEKSEVGKARQTPTNTTERKGGSATQIRPIGREKEYKHFRPPVGRDVRKNL